MTEVYGHRALRRTSAILFIAAAVAAIVAVVLLDPTKNTLYTCFYREVFHIHCPTCGATRAVYYFFTLKFKTAFYYHAYFVATSPLLAYAGAAFVINNLVGKKVVPIKLKWYYFVIYVAGLLVFAVFRNFTTVIY